MDRGQNIFWKAAMIDEVTFATTGNEASTSVHPL